MSSIQYPQVKVLLGNGNVYAIISTVKRAIQREVSNDAADYFWRQSMDCQSYDEVLQLCMRTVDVEGLQ